MEDEIREEVDKFAKALRIKILAYLKSSASNGGAKAGLGIVDTEIEQQDRLRNELERTFSQLRR